MEELLTRISKVPTAQRMLVFAGIILVLPLLTYVVWITDIESNITRQEASINQLETKLVQKKAIARDLTRYRVEVERLKQRLNEALTLLPNQAEIPELLQKLAGLVEQSDCTMSNFSPQKEKKAGFYARIPVKMQVTGSYHAIAVFFDKIAKLARIVNVHDIHLGKPKQVNKKVVLSASFTATTFKFIEKSGPDRPAKAKKGRKK